MGGAPHEGALVLMGFFFEKNCRMGGEGPGLSFHIPAANAENK